MKTIAILWLTCLSFSFFVWTTHLSKGEEQKGKRENYFEPTNYESWVVSDPTGAEPAGDYAKLKYKIKSNKDKYALGEPVFISQEVKNNSEGDVRIGFKAVFASEMEDKDFIVPGEFVLHGEGKIPMIEPPVALFVHDEIHVTDAAGCDIPKTRFGQKEYEKCRTDKIHEDSGGFSLSPSGSTLPLNCEEIQLNRYFDLSKPGTYQITFYRDSFILGQTYNHPLPSNTITIEITKIPFPSFELKDFGRFSKSYSYPWLSKSGREALRNTQSPTRD